MAGVKCVQVARGLLLYGKQIREKELTRKAFLDEIGVIDNSFRAAGKLIGAKGGTDSVRFFDSTVDDEIQFGPGAGLAVGVSLGSESLRAVLVDANGIILHAFDDDPRPDQLSEHPADVLERIRVAVDDVISKGLDDPALHVEDALPLLGVSVAWPAPVNRAKLPVGNALDHVGWNSGQSLDERVANSLQLPKPRCHALNDTAAAAIAVAHGITTEPAHREERIPRLAIVIRLAGGVGGASIVIESPTVHKKLGPVSGFPQSVLTGGVDHLAGEIGHVPIHPAVTEEKNRRLPGTLKKLKPHRCSCAPRSQPVPDHLEAYVSGAAVARRVNPRGRAGVVLRRVLADPDRDVHKRALEDAGDLVAGALAGPVAMLNPASITLTGALAVPQVRDSVKSGLSKVHCFGTHPEVRLLPDEEDKYLRAKGAAMVVLRKKVLRELPAIVGGKSVDLPRKVRGLTLAVDPSNWKRRYRS